MKSRIDLLDEGKIELEVYAVRLRNIQKLKESSSGGMFTALSDCILRRGGVIVCSLYNYATNELEFRLVGNVGERDKARGSKYIQSNVNNIFYIVEKWVRTHPNKELLFVGTGCQAAAFRKFVQLKKFEEHVYIVDLICQGVASPIIWKEYVKFQETKHQGRVEYLTFKDKRFSWRSPISIIKIKNQEIMIPDIVKIINSKYVYRPSCYKCPYARVNRVSDITIGDFWGIEKRIPDFYSPYGNSVVLIHTRKGKILFDELKEAVIYTHSSIKDCIQPQLVRAVSKPQNRTEFWDDYKNLGIKNVMHKYGQIGLLSIFKLRAKSLLGKIKQILTENLKWGDNL